MPETKIVKLKPSFGRVRTINIIKRDLFIPKDIRENMEKAIGKMRYITPSEIALKFGIKVSTAKEFLKEMEKKHVIKKYDKIKNPKLWVYVPV
ncbi:MAG: hypothetical protein ACTSRA_01720 [Promethearchaeota archaeon]